MRRVARVAGWMTLVPGLALVLLGILSWPPGGLMYALPFVFLIPGTFLALLGGGLVWAGSRRPARDRPEPGPKG
jgi:hypothetical protein